MKGTRKMGPQGVRGVRKIMSHVRYPGPFHPDGVQAIMTDDYLDQQLHDCLHDLRLLAVDPDQCRHVSHVQMPLVIDELVEDAVGKPNVPRITRSTETSHDVAFHVAT